MRKGFTSVMRISAQTDGCCGFARSIATIVFLIAAATVLFAFATVAQISAASGDLSPLKLTESYPPNDGKNMPVQNVGIKLFFDGNVAAEAVRKNNSDCFKLTDSKGKTVKTEAYYGSKRNDYILVTAVPKSGSLESDSKYTLTISDELRSADARTLVGEETITFTTVDTTGNTQVYMLLMFVMVAGMIAMTFISNRRKAKAQAEAVMREGKVNPYKLAKDKGITLQQALALIEKEKEKKAKRLSGTSEDGKQKPESESEPEKPHTKRVKGAKPISAGGSAYKTGRKALAEQRAKEAAAKRAKNTSAQKGKKGKGKNKR
ncbi:MAG: Ig-like domain-containing protein [Clostridiales Family XIII bacterium]|jgi:hypothetical protein|nr:Ig-like domain-containing protein [Clostridiales Family XIII bacterium]